MLKTTLIILTLGGADTPSISFATADTAEACAEKAQSLAAVLEGVGYQIIAARCDAIDQQFSPYAHGEAGAKRHAYRVTLPADEGFVIEPLRQYDDCAPAPDADPAVWCATSVQQIVN